MNKLFAKIASITAGLALVVGAGVALASHAEAKSVKADSNTVSFSHSDISGMATAAAASTSGTYSGFTITVGGISSSGFNASESVRVYKGASITISSSVGNMTSVEFTCTANGTTKYGPGSMTGDGYTAGTAKVGTWSGNAASFTLTASANQTRISDFKITYTSGEETNPAISLSNSSLSFLTNDSAKTITVTPNDQFTGTPTISVSGTPSYVNVSVNGLVLSVSPKAIGTEEITVNAVHSSEQASAKFTVTVIDSHGHSADDPYSVAEVIALIDEDTSKTHSSVYVAGIISQIDSYNSTYGSITYWISDDGTTTTQFEAYSGLGLNSAKFSAVTDIEVGASVVLCGDAKYYNGTYEYNYNNYQVSYTAPTTAKVLDHISVDASGAKTSFEVNEAFSSEGIVVTAHYDNSTSKEVTPTSVSSPDMTSIGEKTVTVSYTEGEVTKTAEYQIQVTAPKAKWTVEFNSNGGSGTMDSVQVTEGEDYELPACTFTAPEGKVFDHWADENGDAITVIEDIDDDYVAYATWKDAPSEVDATMTAGTNGSAAKVVVGELEKDAIKVGTSSKGGDMTITVGAGAQYVKFYAAAWKGVTGLSLNITGATVNPASVALTADDGMTSNSPFTLAGNEEDFLFTVYLSDISSETTITLATSTTKRFVLWGAVYGTSGDVPQTPTVESIELSNIQTEYEVGDEFVMPTVTAHYDDESSKVVTNNLNQTGFDSSVAATGQQVTVSYTEGDVTVYATAYSVNISEPTPVATATYKKVKTNLADFTGDYLIVFEDESALAMDGSLTSFGAGDYFSVSISNEVIEASEDHEFHIAAKEGGYSIQAASGKYIGKTADSNGVDANDTDKYVNQISYVGDETSDIDIVAESNGHLRCNGSDHRIVFYKGSTYTGQKAIALYQKVDEAEAFALDILNLTEATCSAQGDAAAYAEAWTTLATKYAAVTDKSKLVETVADANGVMLKEALARYDYLVARFGLDSFIDGRVASGRYIPTMETTVDSNVAIMVVTIVAITSISAIGVILVIKRRKAIR